MLNSMYQLWILGALDLTGAGRALWALGPGSPILQQLSADCLGTLLSQVV